MAATDQPTDKLLPTLTLPALIIFGVGDMLGSGIYALVGKVAGVMGNAVWLAFVTSMVAALMTGLSYAALGSRYPRAAGAAYVSQRAFGWPFLSYVVGLAVMASGLTSMATQSRAFCGYFSALAPGVPNALLIVVFIGALTAVNLWGMRESTWLNFVCTTVEVSGLVIIIAVGCRYWGGVNYLETPTVGGVHTPLGLTMLLNGSLLTFYAFIGFEDMINVVEEVKDPRRTYPLGVMLSLVVVTIIYLAVSVSAVSVVPHAELAASKQPLVEVVRRAAPGFPPLLFSAIALFAITNTALLNYIMGSRLVYGMATQGLLPRWLGAVHPTRRTPHRATLALMTIALALALATDLAPLARATSVLLLSVFVVVNAAMLVLGRRAGEPRGFFEPPAIVPGIGIAVCLALLAHAGAEEARLAGLMLLGIALLYCVVRPRDLTAES